MNQTHRKASVRKKANDRRAFPRTSVLWGAFIVRSDGHSAFDCIIRNINDGGAEISSKKPFELGERIYLVVPRSQIAYLASVVWTNADRMGLSFGRTWDVESGLPAELHFLSRALVPAKLSHMMGLVQCGMPLTEAAASVGWTKDEMEHLGPVPTHRKAVPALLETKGRSKR
jgi:hypothetical protein